MEKPKDYADPLKAIKPEGPLYAIWLVEDAAIYTRMGSPNVWRRFWLWAFFGWRWVRVKDES